MSESEKTQKSTLQSIILPYREAFASRRIAFMAPLGFSSGLPLVLTGSTLAAWMRTEGVDLTTIGFFSWVTMIYSIKFLWAPFMDRYQVPWLTRRRGWMITTQVALLAAIIILGFTDPVRSISAVVVCALIVAFLAASQDIVVDAYRTDLLPTKERASGVAVFVMFYRVALIVSGAGALILSDYLPWKQVYIVVAALMSIGIVATYFTPVPQRKVANPPSLQEAVIEPFRDFFTKRRAGVLLIIVMTYKVGDTVVSQMLTPFLIDLEFTGTEIGTIQKGFGLGATILGALVGGGLVAKLGILKSLFIFGILQAFSNIFYALLALVGKDHTLLVVAIGVDNLFNGLGQAAFVAFLMALCNVKYSATQYALLSSAMSLIGKLLGGGSGAVAEVAGWPEFFLITLIIATPALALIWFVPSEAIDEEPATTER